MENSASIVRAIGGRDVLPIWALPYAMPMGKYSLVSFEEVLHSMAQQARGRIVPEFLTGYQWKPGGEAVPVSPRVWDMHLEDIERITAGLKEKETYEDEHYQLWREECAKRLPTLAFVYVDELTEWHRECIGKHLDEDGTYPYCNFDISSQALHIPYRPEEHELDLDPPIPHPVLAKHKAWFSLGLAPFSEPHLLRYLEAHEVLQSAFHGLTDKEMLIWAEIGALGSGDSRGIIPRRIDGSPINIGSLDKYSGKDDEEGESLRVANRLVPLFFYEREVREADPERWLTYAQLTEQAARIGLSESKVAATILHFLDGADIYDPMKWNGKVMHIYDPLARSRKEREGTSRADKLKTALYRAGWIQEAFPKIDLSGFAKWTPQAQAQQPPAPCEAGGVGGDDDSRYIEMLRHFEAHLKSKAEAVAGTDRAESRFRRICANHINRLLTDRNAHEYPGALFEAPGLYSYWAFSDYLKEETKRCDLQGDRTGKQIAELVLIEWKERLNEYLHQAAAAPPPAVGNDTPQAAPEKLTDAEPTGTHLKARKIHPMKELKNQNDEYRAIRDAARDHEKEEGYTPSEPELWLRLQKNPPKAWGIAWNKQKNSLNFNGKMLDREAFKKRFKRYWPEVSSD